MSTTKSIFAVIVTIAAAPVNAYAGDRQTNPLHPAYFAERNSVEFAATEGARYVDSGNPLHPAFVRNGQTDNWLSTGKGDGKPYADTRNPRYPSYRKL